MSSSNDSNSTPSAEKTVHRFDFEAGDFTEMVNVKGTCNGRFGNQKITFSTRTVDRDHPDVPKEFTQGWGRSYQADNAYNGEILMSEKDVRWYPQGKEQAVEVSWIPESFREIQQPDEEYPKVEQTYTVLALPNRKVKISGVDSAYVPPVEDDKELGARGPKTYTTQSQGPTREKRTKDSKASVALAIDDYWNKPNYSHSKIVKQEDGTYTKVTFSKATKAAGTPRGSQSSTAVVPVFRKTIRGTSTGTAHVDSPWEKDRSQTFHLPDADVTFDWEVERNYTLRDGEKAEPVYHDEAYTAEQVYTAKLKPRGVVAKRTVTRRMPSKGERPEDAYTDLSEPDPKAGLRAKTEGEFYQQMFDRHLGDEEEKWCKGYGSEIAEEED